MPNGVEVAVAVGEAVGVDVRVEVAVAVGVGVRVEVAVAVLVGVEVAVGVDVRVGVAVGVLVGPPAIEAAAAPAFTIPLPQMDVLQVLPPGKLVTVFCRICNTWAGVRDGLSEYSSETTPVTCGAAMLVPW
jgi:hypothetical protein